MPRNSARTRSINIPKEFLPLIMEETEQKGYFSSVQTMGEILSEHFKKKGNKPAPITKEATIKEVKE